VGPVALCCKTRSVLLPLTCDSTSRHYVPTFGENIGRCANAFLTMRAPVPRLACPSSWAMASSAHPCVRGARSPRQPLSGVGGSIRMPRAVMDSALPSRWPWWRRRTGRTAAPPPVVEVLGDREVRQQVLARLVIVHLDSADMASCGPRNATGTLARVPAPRLSSETFVHQLPAEAISNVNGDSRHIRARC
jgi:hypothetical protein